MPIEHVADTALWVASHRAAENTRPDALFHDPLAEVLAGERGREIAQSMPASHVMTWVMAIRTATIDRLVLDGIRLGADTVLNIGAGLDTRPYRLPLPPELRWIEVDFPTMIDYKTERLRVERPVCHLEHVALDLTDTEARRSLLARVGREGRCVLVLTEGVLPYLTNDAVGTLADDIHAVPQLQYWVQDYYNGSMRDNLPARWRRKLRAAPMKFHVDDWFAFFQQHGWQVKERVALMDEATRLGRPFPMVFPSTVWVMLRYALRSLLRRKRTDRASGYAMLERVS